MVGLLLLWWALACAPPTQPQVELTPTGLRVQGEAIDKVEVLDPQGVPLLIQRAPAPVGELSMPVAWEQGGPHRVRVSEQDEVHELSLEVPAERPAFLVQLEAPVGQERVRVEDGDELALSVVEGGTARIAVVVTALSAGPARVQVGQQAWTEELLAGQRLVALSEVSTATDVLAQGLRFRVVPEALDPDSLELVGRVLPAEAGGRPDPSRPRDRVTLPSRWWSSALKNLGLGYRRRDSWSAWAWQGVSLHNHGDQDLNVVVQTRILDEDGVAEAFKPRVRDGDDGSGELRALLRVPAGQTATASIPVYADASQLRGGEQVTAEVQVIPLGASSPLIVDRRPLYVSRGSTLASVGLIAALGAALLGSLLLAVRGRRWLSEARTSELMTIALFGALTFLVGAAGRLLTTGVAMLLGPFATFLTALVDDTLRYALLACLLTLLPRRGVASLAVLVGWLLSGLALGSFSPTDLLFVGGRVFWLELFLWLAGITRVSGWQEGGALSRWLRLSLGFGLASLLTSATGLVLHVTLYRLFLAPWYVAGVLIGPGFLYVVVACGFALPFADSLRRIQR
jgi:hypothetical protein